MNAPFDNAPGVVPILRWTSVGQLASHEYYHVTLSWQPIGGGEVRWWGYDTPETEWAMKPHEVQLFRIPGTPSKVTWWVAVYRQAGTTWLPGAEGQRVSPDSQPRIFILEP